MSKESPVSVSCTIKIKVDGIEKEITRADACELLTQLKFALGDTHDKQSITPYPYSYPQVVPVISPLTPTCGSGGKDLY